MPSWPYGRIGLPLRNDWVTVAKLVKVLRYFYDLTNQSLGSLYVTSNTFLDEISDVDDLLNEWLKGDDVYSVDMARQMKAKFDKYWGNIEKMNMMLYVVVILDPRHKYSYLRYVFKNMHGQKIGEKMGDLVKYALYDVFEEYKKMYSSTPSRPSTTSSVESSQELDDDIGRREVRDKRKKWKQMVSEIGDGHRSESDTYLNEGIETDESPSFSITEWWKLHTPRFSILARLARNVLAMPISTVASESAFSNGGHIINDFRASLTPKMAQALIYCQDWLRRAPFKPVEEDYVAIDKIIKNVVSNVGSESTIIRLWYFVSHKDIIRFLGFSSPGTPGSQLTREELIVMN
ncbi:UNVERIFIED_CONTAM: putative AC transposase [Sesamum radiatum]|uniref:AC transposase n=1 Tax=Sesamum radiatum TaxID=300843 RepID=A0AAW2KBW6_SESRA